MTCDLINLLQKVKNFVNIWFIIYKEIVYFSFYFFASLKIIGCCSSQVSIYVSCFFHFRACVRYFFIKFLFFHQMIALQKRWKMFFISSKKLFSFTRYSDFCNFSSFHTFQIQKKTNGSGIIYDVMNWLA